MCIIEGLASLAAAQACVIARISLNENIDS